MAKGVLESIFDTKNLISDLNPTYPGIINFDLERKHHFYGRLDNNGDAILPDTNFLVGVESAENATNLLLDFVADAFFSLKMNYRKATRTAFVGDSPFYKDLKVYKSSTHGNTYDDYIKILYKNFVDVYLASSHRVEKIKNYKDFIKEFLRYALEICYYYPITRTGFTTSIHCSPFASGLMLEIAPENHGIENNKSIIKYLEDDYYEFWAREVAKFGFMVDKNAPWRLVFNLASGNFARTQENKLSGAQLFMGEHGISYDNVFQYRYTKAYKSDLLNIKNTMYSLYELFYRQFSTYEEEGFQFDKNGRCRGVKVVHERRDREPPTIIGSDEQEDEYWLRVLLKLRMAETRYPHTSFTFASHVKDMIERYRIFDLNIALKYINNLTKGFAVPRFNIKGEGLHGVSAIEYERRRQTALENIENPRNVQYSLTGTGNTFGS